MHVRRLAEQLPNAPFAINLCENRYSFMIALAAAMLRGQTTLLPPARTRKVVEELAADYAGSYCVLDSPFEAEGIEQHIVSPDPSSTASDSTRPARASVPTVSIIPPDQTSRFAASMSSAIRDSRLTSFSNVSDEPVRAIG